MSFKYKNLTEKPEGKRPFGSKITLNLTVKKREVSKCNGFMWLRIGPSCGAFMNTVMNHPNPIMAETA
jgi:hypothetical protein